jgi:4a-hydroxytetrahydrobiopterin dehydratase
MQSNDLPDGWALQQNELYRKIVFTSFAQAFQFITKMATLAEAVNHHPRWAQNYTQVEVWLTTHDEANTVTEKDIELAIRINQLPL